MPEDKFSGPMKKIISQCVSCRHYLGNFACKAYRFGVPRSIYANKIPHTSPQPGDNGTRYAPKLDS